MSALRVVGATAVRGDVFDEARQPHPRDDWREAGGSLQTGLNTGFLVAVAPAVAVALAVRRPAQRANIVVPVQWQRGGISNMLHDGNGRCFR